MGRYAKACATVLLYTALSGCGGKSLVSPERDGPGSGRRSVEDIADAVPRAEPKSRYGNPESYEVFGQRYYVMDSAEGYQEEGIASWYGTKFHGKRTSSGEPYDMYAMTAAHKTLPLPTYVEVTALETGRSVVVKVNDRGPFHQDRIIDLSYVAAIKLGIDKAGTGMVRVRTIGPGETRVADAAADDSEVKQQKREEDRLYAPVRVVAPATAGIAGPTTEPASTAAAPAPAAVQDDVASGRDGFFIQFGVFEDSDNAHSLYRRLQALGEKSLAVISGLGRDGKPLYRVRVGPMMDIRKADEIVDRLLRLGMRSYQIVTE